MSSKHTPGPWEAVKRAGDEWYFGGKDGAEIVISYGGQSFNSVAVIGANLSKEGQPDADATLIAAAPELLEALVWREQFESRDGEHCNETFERVGEVFQKETGYLRPGKDCRLNSHEIRKQAWDEWMNAGRAKVRAAIAKATGEPT